jgi:hypoxanthine-guanine phosphoribosyltransferase
VSESVTDSGTESGVTQADPRLDGRAVKRIVYDAATIQARVATLGEEITAAYPDGDLLVLGLLKGSFIFLSDLVRHVARPLQVDFLVASSYGDAMESSGVVRLLYDPETELEGKHILLVEDIVDSGRNLCAPPQAYRDRVAPSHAVHRVRCAARIPGRIRAGSCRELSAPSVRRQSAVRR